MSTLEKFFTGAFILIGIYLFVINGENTSRLISTGGTTASNIFATLQGRGSGGRLSLI